jgi:hypothetical protein
MNDREYQKERRKQRRVEQFPPDADCIICGEINPCCLQWHHVAGRAFGDDQIIACQNHHSQLSEKQKDHPLSSAHVPTRTECEGRQLLGIADLLELLHNPPELVELTRRTGLDLIEQAQLFSQPDDGDRS